MRTLLFVVLFFGSTARAQTVFTADFADGTASAFVPRGGTDSWKIQKQTLAQTAPTGWQWASLHVFSLTHTFWGRFRVDNAAKTGFVGWLVRMNLAVTDSAGNLSGSYVRVGYDFGKSRYQISEQEEWTEPVRVAPTAGRSTTTPLKPGTWHTFEIQTNLNDLTLRVDGREVAKTNALRHRTYGRVALLTHDATAAFDDLQLDTPEGRVERGVVSSDQFMENGLRGESAFCRTKSGRLLRLHDGKLSESPDDGLTWSTETPTFAGLNSLGGTPQLLSTHSGRLVSVRAFGNGQSSTAHWAENLWAVVSDDEGRTWRKTGQITPSRAAIMADVVREIRLTNGRYRLFLFLNNERLEAGNVQRVVFSDDDGETWQRAFPEWPAAYPNEGKMVDWGGGKLRIIARPRGKVTWQGRNETPCVDCVSYCESSDGGQTWGDWACFDNLPTNTTSLNAREDPYDSDKIYLVWNYNLAAHEPNSCGPQEVSPRTRQALAWYSKRSKTWAYLMDVDDWEYPSYAGPITQDTRYMNHTLFIDRDYVYLDIHRANAYSQSCHFEHKSDHYEGTYFLRKAKKDLVPYSAFPPLHYARNGIIPGLKTPPTPPEPEWDLTYDSLRRQLTVTLRLSPDERALAYELVAYQGQRIVKEVAATGTPSQTISIADLPKGGYYLQLRTNRRRLTKRLTNQFFR
jgi:hypothetical protein